MKKKYVYISFILVFLFQNLIFSIEIVTKKSEEKVAWLECYFLTKGPFKITKESKEGILGQSYRVGFIQSEGKHSITVERIIFSSIENPEGEESLNYTLVVDTSDMISLSEQSNVPINLKFLKWKSPNTFIIEMYNKKIKLKILDSKKLISF